MEEKSTYFVPVMWIQINWTISFPLKHCVRRDKIPRFYEMKNDSSKKQVMLLNTNALIAGYLYK